jgi:hypothetical protein
MCIRTAGVCQGTRQSADGKCREEVMVRDKNRGDLRRMRRETFGDVLELVERSCSRGS